MRAIQVLEFGGPEVLLVSEIPIPTPSPSQVLVQVKAAGLNPVDALCRSGQASWVSTPFTPGFDAAGIIVKADTLGRWKEGDHVYLSQVSGCYAEYLCCEADAPYSLPESTDFETGAALGIPYFTAFGSIFRRAGLQPGETLFVRGASGAVGMAAVQFASARGHKVFGTAGSDEGLKLVRENGAAETFDHRKNDIKEKILAASSGRGVDVILEVRSENIQEDLEILAPQGRVVLVGDRSRISLDPMTLTQRSASILGFNVGSTAYGGSMSAADYAAADSAVRAGLLNGTIRPNIAARYPLEEVRLAHEALGRSGLNGKIILNP